MTGHSHEMFKTKIRFVSLTWSFLLLLLIAARLPTHIFLVFPVDLRVKMHVLFIDSCIYTISVPKTDSFLGVLLSLLCCALEGRTMS